MLIRFAILLLAVLCSTQKSALCDLVDPDPSSSDPEKILGLIRPYTQNELRQAKTRAVKLYFPDHAPQGSLDWKTRNDRLRKSLEAFEKLSQVAESQRYEPSSDLRPRSPGLRNQRTRDFSSRYPKWSNSRRENWISEAGPTDFDQILDELDVSAIEQLKVSIFDYIGRFQLQRGEWQHVVPFLSAKASIWLEQSEYAESPNHQDTLNTRIRKVIVLLVARDEYSAFESLKQLSESLRARSEGGKPFATYWAGLQVEVAQIVSSQLSRSRAKQFLTNFRETKKSCALFLLR